jgi:hypothetical protein
LFSVKNANFFAEFFGEKNHNIGPCLQETAIFDDTEVSRTALSDSKESLTQECRVGRQKITNM